MSKGLTKTQSFILRQASANERGLIRFGRTDRKGTRIAGHDKSGIPVIIAYGCPQYFLEGRGLLSKNESEPGVYLITEKGRSVLANTREVR